MSTLWGSIPAVEDEESAVIALEQEQLSKPRCVEVSAPPIHQPSLNHYPPLNQSLPSEDFELDAVTQHTVQLVQYMRRVNTVISSIRQCLQEQKTAAESGLMEHKPVCLPTTPPIPQYADYTAHTSRRCSEKTREIDSKTSRKLLRKSVAAVVCHTGYHSCCGSVLDTMTDLTHQYLTQFTQLLRTAVDDEALHGTTGFPDAVERVLQEMGCGNSVQLERFYKTRVLAYHDHMIRQCEKLHDQCEEMRRPGYKLEDLRSARLSRDESVCSDSGSTIQGSGLVTHIDPKSVFTSAIDSHVLPPEVLSLAMDIPTREDEVKWLQGTSATSNSRWSTDEDEDYSDLISIQQPQHKKRKT